MKIPEIIRKGLRLPMRIESIPPKMDATTPATVTIAVMILAFSSGILNTS